MLIAGRAIEGIGLGIAQFIFGDGTPEDSVATVHAALDAGVMLVDTVLAYTAPAPSPQLMHQSVPVPGADRTGSCRVDLLDRGLRPFRCIPPELWAVENNLNIANMDWESFADEAGEDGVYRGLQLFPARKGTAVGTGGLRGDDLCGGLIRCRCRRCRSRSRRLELCDRLIVGAGQERHDLADGAFPAVGLGKRQVGLDLVAVAAAVLVLDDVAGLGEVGDDAVGGALGDADSGRDVAQPHARVAGDAQQHPGVVGQEAPVRHACKLP